ncbi:cation-translocating P-type ATPase [Massilia sp. W12]|uniref:heavy metal translocating P-type ATPase n=1 Tax=Massilia sp. W12 TaxID=3126507 RepID=UPI0030CB324A
MMTQASNQAPRLRSERLQLSGLRCAACAQIIDYRVRQLAGVTQAKLLSGALLEIQFDPALIQLKQISEAIFALGYGALPQGVDDAAEKLRQKRSWWRLFIAGFAMMQIMMYAFPAWLEPHPGPDSDLTPDIDFMLKLACLALSLPVLLFSAMPFYQNAWRDLKNRHLGMDVPVTIGIWATFVASVWATFAGGAVYYDSLVMFVTLLLAARIIEQRVQNKSSAALRELTSLQQPQAEYCPDWPQLTLRSVAAADLPPGAVVRIGPGAQIPVDGLVLQGESECDEALMSGEARPVLKQPGAQVLAGAINLSGVLYVQSSASGDATRFSQLLSLMERAAADKPPLVQLADRHASRFLAAIILIAIAGGLAWLKIDPARALEIGLMVLVITCPCALSLATPAVMAALTGQLAKRGVLLARGRAVESLARADVFVFDKTGTLSSGRLQLRHFAALSAADEAQIWDQAAALAAHSLHPLARALCAAQQARQLSQAEERADAPPPAAQAALAGMQQAAPELPPQAVLQEVAGRGLQAQLADGGCWRLGRADFAAPGCSLPPLAPAYAADSHALFAIQTADGTYHPQAWFAFADAMRSGARELLQALQDDGRAVWILSGDRTAAVQACAQALGVPPAQALGDLSPQQKYEQVRRLQAGGKRLAMSGDGMNDGPVLSAADVALAIGEGAPLAQARSDILLLSSDLQDLRRAWRACRRALSLIKQNLAWALLYNLLAVPAALSGLLTPWHAALGMSLSSIIVVLNSLRMLRQEAA